MIERDLSEPDRIVGELLQPGGYLKLIELGLQGKQPENMTGFNFHSVTLKIISSIKQKSPSNFLNGY